MSRIALLPPLFCPDLYKNLVIQLKNLCRSVGVSPSGTKTELIGRLRAQLEIPFPDRPWSIISLDIGLLNFAKVKLDISDIASQPTLTEWTKITLDERLVGGQIREAAIAMRALCQSLTNEMGNNNDSDKGTVYLIEKQTFRGGGIRMIPGIVQKIKTIETQLHCFLVDHNVVSIDPKMVASLFSLQAGRKKQDAVRLADKLIADSTLTGITLPPIVPDSSRHYYQNHSKRDDLADALLQALAYHQWRLNLEKLRAHLVPK